MVLAKDREELINTFFWLHTGNNAVLIEGTMTQVVLPVFKSPSAIQQNMNFK